MMYHMLQSILISVLDLYLDNCTRILLCNKAFYTDIKGLHRRFWRENLHIWKCNLQKLIHNRIDDRECIQLIIDEGDVHNDYAITQQTIADVIGLPIRLLGPDKSAKYPKNGFLVVTRKLLADLAELSDV
jgi:hypothetical protein